MATTQARINTQVGRSTGNVTVGDYQTPAYAATVNIVTKPTSEETLLNFATLTGAMTVNIAVVNPLIGDRIKALFVADSGGPYIVTFGTGVAATGTLTVAASKYGTANLTYNGTVWIMSGAAPTV